MGVRAVNAIALSNGASENLFSGVLDSRVVVSLHCEGVQLSGWLGKKLAIFFFVTEVYRISTPEHC